ncbi:MAG: carbon storage regulator [Oscillospiraceae bacterium]|nr:carbon storage regulator [Oscillospiraceae bacterium]
MLNLSLLPEEYLTINGNIVVQATRVAGGRTYLAIHAPREMPVVRGTVWEREGGERPACLTPPGGKRPRVYRDRFFPWNDDRERAAQAVRRLLDQLAQEGAEKTAAALRRQLERIVPAVWEDAE